MKKIKILCVILVVLLFGSLLGASRYSTFQIQQADAQVRAGLEQTIAQLYIEVQKANRTAQIAQEALSFQGRRTQNYKAKIETLERRIASPPIPGQPRDFRDMAELYQFLAKDGTDKLPWKDPDRLCSEFTLILAEKATKAGYRIFPVLLVSHRGNYLTGLHSMNFALVDSYSEGNEKYRYVMLIEPQTDEVWIFGRFAKDDVTKKIEMMAEQWYPFLPF